MPISTPLLKSRTNYNLFLGWLGWATWGTTTGHQPRFTKRGMTNGHQPMSTGLT
jgi:hypothetical protein